MTTRKPLVSLSGDVAELPNGDDLASTLLPALSQILGYTPANILEIEAATKAARIVFQPQAGASERELAFSVSHHAIGVIGSHNNTTSYVANTEIITAGNISAPFIGFLRQVKASALTEAVSGARVGTCHLDLHEIKGLSSFNSTFQWVLPPIGTAGDPMTNSVDYKSLLTAQESPLLIIQALRAATGAAGIFTGMMNNTKLLGTAVGGAKTAIETNIPPTTLFDHLVDGAFVFGPASGFHVSSTFPAAATSQSIRASVSLVWDEWQIRQPSL